RARTSGGLDAPSRLGEANGSATTVTRARLAEGMLVALLGSGAALVLLPLLPVAEQALTRLGRGNWTGGQVQALGVTLLVLVLGWMAVRSFPLLVNRIRAGIRHLDAPPLWLRLAADSMARHSRRAGATAISLMITVAGLVGVYGAADSYQASLRAWLDASVSWDLMVSSGPAGAGAITPLPGSATDVAAAVAGVAQALPERSVTVSSSGRAVPLVAFDAGAENPSRRLRATTAVPAWRGDVAAALRRPATIALSSALAARLEV